jgi:hypothetical protein
MRKRATGAVEPGGNRFVGVGGGPGVGVLIGSPKPTIVSRSLLPFRPLSMTSVATSAISVTAAMIITLPTPIRAMETRLAFTRPGSSRQQQRSTRNECNATA